MPKIAKSPIKKTTVKAKKVTVATKKPAKIIKKISTPEIKVKAPIKISKTYIPKETEKYMCDKHLSFNINSPIILLYNFCKKISKI